ncbi:MAG: YeeE/YedE family protein [Polyangiaceae bacterium]
MLAFTPFASTLGGALIGASASLLLAFHGRIAGISGIFGGVILPKRGDTEWRVWFLAGLVVTGVAWRIFSAASFGAPVAQSLSLAVIAGLLVGVGTQLGNGCTSGHGVCGISRGSKRSITATTIFMGAAALTVFVVRHVLGAS